MNKSYTSITVHTTEPGKIIYNKDTIQTSGNKASLNVERNNEILKIVAVTGSVTKSFEIHPRNSFLYWSNIFYNCGIGMLVDRKDPKRYSYPKAIYINSSDPVLRSLHLTQSSAVRMSPTTDNIISYGQTI